MSTPLPGFDHALFANNQPCLSLISILEQMDSQQGEMQ